ncbi:MAG: diphosphomevalonate decarboxylase [Thermoplasmata archaeon]|nr:diphosphomevalonate decarboxylase [Thermoplasmata archaeon]MCI4356224.1 diphosphomevalonate decarboxylase [Thermoplasmata archaeon]
MARRPVEASFEAAPNIALVKYWGVRDEALGLPYNSSLSVTLNRLRTRTTVRFDPKLSSDRFLLDGEAQSGGPLTSVSGFLDTVRAIARFETHALVRSTNNFQTASGLASSASGFAALAGAASLAAGLHLSPADLSRLARLGSGSASRSLFGGFVEWRAGTRSDGRDCFARPLHPPSHWPSLVDLVAIIADAPTKPVRSSVAMQRTVATSPTYAQRQRELPRRLRAMKRAIAVRDAPTLFDLTMEECDSFRNVCETTVPTLDYLVPASRAVLADVRAANEENGTTLAGYTHDAGAHVHVFTLQRHAGTLRRRLARIHGVAKVLALSPGRGARPIRRWRA